jgi:hypothetical protein
MTIMTRNPVLVVGLIVGFALATAELVGSGEAWRAVLSGGIPIVYAAIVTLVGHRGDAVSILAGRPIDERATHVSGEASTWAFGLSAIAVVGAVAWQIGARGDWAPYAAVAVVMAVAYLGSLLVLQARH